MVGREGSWLAVGNELALLDLMLASGGTGFIDLRKSPVPPIDEEPGDDVNQEARDDGAQMTPPTEGEVPELPQVPPQQSTVSSTTQSEARAESERDARRARRSSEFFVSQEAKRRRRGSRSAASGSMPSPVVPRPENVPVDAAGAPDPDLLDLPEMETLFEPDLDDYHQALPRRQLTPNVTNPEMEAAEQRLRTLSTRPRSSASTWQPRAMGMCTRRPASTTSATSKATWLRVWMRVTSCLASGEMFSRTATRPSLLSIKTLLRRKGERS